MTLRLATLASICALAFTIVEGSLDRTVVVHGDRPFPWR